MLANCFLRRVVLLRFEKREKLGAIFPAIVLALVISAIRLWLKNLVHGENAKPKFYFTYRFEDFSELIVIMDLKFQFLSLCANMHINSQKRMELSFIFLIFIFYKVRIYKKNEG